MKDPVRPMKESMLFGFPKYDVESAADNIMRAKELEKSKPELHAAAMKLLGRRQNAIMAILKASGNKRG